MKPELINIYPIEVCHLPDGLRIYFPSYGIHKAVKVVEFTSIGQYKDVEVFNVGFGDYNEKTDTVNDRIISNNGDSHTASPFSKENYQPGKDYFSIYLMKKTKS